MATYASFQNKIGIGAETTWNTAVAGGASMPAGSPKGLPTTNFVDFLQGVSTIESNKYHGTSYRRMDVSERLRGIKLPGTTLEFDFNPVDVIPFLGTLFQRDGSNAVQGASAHYAKTFTAYTADPDLASKSAVWAPQTAGSSVPLSLTLIKETGATGESHELSGAICRSLTLSGEVDQPLKCSAEIIAGAMTTNNTTSGDTFTFSGDTSELFQDMTFELATTATCLYSFNLNITNNAIQKTCNNQTVQKIVYGMIEATGSITLPWDGANTYLDAYAGAISSNIVQLEFGSSGGIDGTCGTSGDWYVECPAILTGYRETETDGEKTMEIDFESLYDGTYLASNEGPINIIVADGLDWT